MTAQPTREEFDHLLAAHKALEARHAAESAALRRRLDRPRRRRALLVALVPLSMLATTPFDDLTGGVHDANIDAIYQAGVTKGCVPDVSYCPTANVTREEMANFLARLGGLGSNPPVAHALTAQTAGTATSAESAASAASADTVGNFAPRALVRVARATDGADIATGPYSVTAVSPHFQTLVTLSITAPAPGFALVSGSLAVQHIDSGLSSLRTRLRHAQDEATSPQTQTLGYFGGETQGLAYAFPVAAGTQTFVLESYITGGINWNAGSGVPTALFVPFGYDGGTTLAP